MNSNFNESSVFLKTELKFWSQISHATEYQFIYALKAVLSKFDKTFLLSGLVSSKRRVNISRRFFETMVLLICIALTALTLLLVFYYFHQKFSYFKIRKIEGPSPGIFGNTKLAFFKQKHLTFEVGKIYEYAKKQTPDNEKAFKKTI